MMNWTSRMINTCEQAFSQCNEGRLANLTQPRDARRRACWTLVMVLHSWSHHRHDNDFHVIHRRFGPKSDNVKTARIIHSAQRTITRFAWFPILAKQMFTVVLVAKCLVRVLIFLTGYPHFHMIWFSIVSQLSYRRTMPLFAHSHYTLSLVKRCSTRFCALDTTFTIGRDFIPKEEMVSGDRCTCGTQQGKVTFSALTSTFVWDAQFVLIVFDCFGAWLQQERHNNTNDITMLTIDLSK